MVTVTSQRILDNDPTAGGVRSESYVFDLLDEAHNVLGRLDVWANQSPRITLDTSRSIMRTLSGVQVLHADIDTRKHRVRPSLVLSDGTQWPLGVFMFGNDVRGAQWQPDLFDESFILGQALDRTYSIPKGGSILGGIATLLGDAKFPVLQTGVADQAAMSPLIYTAGSLRIDAVNALAALLVAYPLYLDNNGVPTLRGAAAYGQPADHAYASGGRILKGLTTITHSWYKAPNRYIVTSNDVQATVVGVYDLPPEAPNSYANTGTYVTSVTQMPGISTKAQADGIARALAITDTTSYATGTFGSTVDPRHDAFDLVQLYGVRYQETGWDITCKPGAPMTHNLVGIYG